MPDSTPQTDDRPDPRRRVQTVFGWIAGISLGMLVSYVAFLAIGIHYPREIGTFVLSVGGAFLGMWVADRSGPRGFRPLGIAAGVLFALVIALGLLVVLVPAR